MCYDMRDFTVHELRPAVDYLRLQPQTGFTGLVARCHTSAGLYKLLAEPMLQLREILGKTPNQVWEMFDEGVDRWRKGLINRDQGGYAL